jgi:hypothetical protein
MNVSGHLLNNHPQPPPAETGCPCFTSHHARGSSSIGYVFLANDTTPGYTDTTPFPTTPAKWTYRAIYRVGDEQVGQWSAPVSVAVAA